MSFFCFLWIPLFYFFWRTITGANNVIGGIWALLLGSAAGLAQFFLGSLVESGGFGFSRWLSGVVDIVVLPAIIPLFICVVLFLFRVFKKPVDIVNFSLLWLIPCSAVRTFSWSSQKDPVILVLVPVLWTAIAVGIPFSISLILNSRRWMIAPAVFIILGVPLAAASSYWAFYSQRASQGLAFGIAAAAPMLAAIVLSFLRAERRFS